MVEGPQQTFYSFKGLSYPDPPGMDGDFEFDFELKITKKNRSNETTYAPYPHLDWLQESSLYDTFISGYDSNSGYFVHAQPVYCRNSMGSAIDEAEKLG